MGSDIQKDNKQKVVVSAAKINGAPGYDVRVSHPEATVRDYLLALNEAIEKLSLERLRAPGRAQCKGCDLCCKERLPITAIDVLALQRAAGIPDLYTWLSRYGHISVNGQVVDITLARSEKNCCLLDAELKLCRFYGSRPLACQSFVCCPKTERAAQLRDMIINLGEDELTRLWWSEAEGGGRTLLIHQADDARLDSIQLPPNAFSGKRDYSEVRLKDICPPELWRELTRMQGAGGKRWRYK